VIGERRLKAKTATALLKRTKRPISAKEMPTRPGLTDGMVQIPSKEPTTALLFLYRHLAFVIIM
jgi:hypothetical protein